MKRYSNTQSKIQSNHSGFTLIELMVVIGLIALLASLLLVATGGVRGNAKRAEVKAELSGIESALAGFSKDFGGQLPPSEITLYELEADWNSDPRSKAIIRSLWPQFDFSITRDFDAGGSATNVLLQGPHCLVFFLGGLPLIDPNPPETESTDVRITDDIIYVRGFSKNPANPFDPTSENRTAPYFKFDPARLKPGTSYGLSPDISLARPFAYVSYFDKFQSQTSPIWYLSSYGGRGYRNTDLPNSMIAPPDSQRGGNPAIGNGVYKQGKNSISPAWKSDSYQLISPGLDGNYGLGGVFTSDGKTKFTGKDGDSSLNPGEGDKDNITNFSSGTLD